MRNIVSFIILVITLQSCENKTQKIQKIEPQKIIEIQNQKKQVQTFTGTFEFISYNDDGDYMLLYARKEKNFYSFINDKNDDRKLLKGDVCEIQWKEDTIYIAGDEETPQLADWLIKIKKIKDGKVSIFRKTYKNELKYHYSTEYNYTDNFLDQIYLATEYYIANSDNELIKMAINDNQKIEYSIEEQEKDNRIYYAIGIGIPFEHKLNIVQWIYRDVENNKLFEYDLPNDKLILFE